MEQPLRIITKKGLITGIFFGLSQGVMYMIFGSIFLAGAAFIRDNIITTDY